MISINENSWHAQITSVVRDLYRIRSLCQYVRWFLWSVMVCSCIAFFLGVMALSLIAVPLQLLGWWDLGGWGNDSTHLLLAVGSALWFLFSVIALGLGVERGIKRISFRRHYKPEKEPSLLMQYIKAKKQKICPMVEFK